MFTEKDISNYTWNLLQYISNNEEKVLIVSDEIYRQRSNLCRMCEKIDEVQNICTECGCYIPAKARQMLDSCPLHKWPQDHDAWKDKFPKLRKEMKEMGYETLDTTPWILLESLCCLWDRTLATLWML